MLWAPCAGHIHNVWPYMHSSQWVNKNQVYGIHSMEMNAARLIRSLKFDRPDLHFSVAREFQAQTWPSLPSITTDKQQICWWLRWLDYIHMTFAMTYFIPFKCYRSIEHFWENWVSAFLTFQINCTELFKNKMFQLYEIIQDHPWLQTVGLMWVLNPESLRKSVFRPLGLVYGFRIHEVCWTSLTRKAERMGPQSLASHLQILSALPFQSSILWST